MITNEINILLEIPSASLRGVLSNTPKLKTLSNELALNQAQVQLPLGHRQRKLEAPNQAKCEP